MFSVQTSDKLSKFVHEKNIFYEINFHIYDAIFVAKQTIDY